MLDLIASGLLDWLMLPSIFIVGSSLWVWLDARAKGLHGQRRGVFDMGPFAWFLCCLVLWVVAFPAYLAVRNEYAAMGGKFKPCPHCAETIRAEATKCRHCGGEVVEG
jgi:hypothetical protein